MTHNYDSFLGIPIRSTLDNSTTVQYAGLIMQLTNKARSTVSMTSSLRNHDLTMTYSPENHDVFQVRDLDPQNDLTFVRVISKKYELIIAPGESQHESFL